MRHSGPEDDEAGAPLRALLADELLGRRAVQQAIGVLMAERGITADDALAGLQATSERFGHRLTELAEEVLAQARLRTDRRAER